MLSRDRHVLSSTQTITPDCSSDMAMVVSNDIAREKLECTKHDYMALRAVIKGMVVQGSSL